MSFIDELKMFEILEGERRVVERLRCMGLVGERKRPVQGSEVIQFPIERVSEKSEQNSDQT